MAPPDGEEVADGGDAQAVRPRLVYMQAKKLKVYNGDSNLEDWLREARALLRAQALEGQKAVDFLVPHLEGPAKEEIRFHKSELSDSEAVFKALQEVFGEKLTATQLLCKFRNRRQEQGEGIREYSHALMGLLNRAVKRRKDLEAQKDDLLRDQFVEHLRDSVLRRELWEKVWEDETSTFLQMRARALRWEESEVRADAEVEISETKASMQKGPGPADPAIDKLTLLLEGQQKVLEQQQQTLQILTAAMQGLCQQGSWRPAVGVVEAGECAMAASNLRTLSGTALPSNKDRDLQEQVSLTSMLWQHIGICSPCLQGHNWAKQLDQVQESSPVWQLLLLRKTRCFHWYRPSSGTAYKWPNTSHGQSV